VLQNIFRLCVAEGSPLVVGEVGIGSSNGLMQRSETPPALQLRGCPSAGCRGFDISQGDLASGVLFSLWLIFNSAIYQVIDRQ
jgi:hypothetical protein